MDERTGPQDGPSARGRARPQDIVDRSLRAFFVAPLVQTAAIWIAFAIIAVVQSGGEVKLTMSSGFWKFVALGLIVSYVIAGMLGVATHVICVKLGFWRLWHYLLAGLLAGSIPPLLLGIALSGKAANARMIGLAVYSVPSALVVALVVWLMVFWRNPPPVKARIESP